MLGDEDMSGVSKHARLASRVQVMSWRGLVQPVRYRPVQGSKNTTTGLPG